jgi:hypothetical protein
MSDPIPPEIRPRRSRVAVWGAIAAIAGLAVTGIVISQVTAATAAQTPTPSASPTDPASPPDHSAPGTPGDPGDPEGSGPPWPPGRGGLGLGKLGPALHGEFTVETSDGEYQVRTVQRGAVTGTGTDTVTVKSEDGYTATYRIDDDTRIIKDGEQAKLADLAKDDSVYVVGVKSGSTVTARLVQDGCLAEKGFRRGGGPRWWRPGPPAEAPSSDSASA